MSAFPEERALVEVRGVNKYFGQHHVLKDIDLDVQKGEVVIVIGPSGSGKSTLCRSINRLETIDSGEIYIDGNLLPEEGKQLAQLRSEVGMVFQAFNLFAHKTVLENVTLAPIKVHKQSKADAEKRAMELLDMVGLADKAKNMPAQLSGGQKQRVAIARALALSPKIMLFDEVTSALDPELVEEVLNVMRKLAAETDMTMLLVTHEMGFAHDFADRVLFFDRGKIVEEGKPDEIFRNPRQERTQTFLRKIIAAGHRV